MQFFAGPSPFAGFETNICHIAAHGKGAGGDPAETLHGGETVGCDRQISPGCRTAGVEILGRGPRSRSRNFQDGTRGSDRTGAISRHHAVATTISIQCHGGSRIGSCVRCRNVHPLKAPLVGRRWRAGDGHGEGRGLSGTDVTVNRLNGDDRGGVGSAQARGTQRQEPHQRQNKHRFWTDGNAGG